MAKKEEQKVVSLDSAIEAEDQSFKQKRGWIFDEIVKVGQLEAAMGHNDEQICNLYSDMEGAETPEELEKIADELNVNYEIIRIDYRNRVDALNFIFDSVRGSDRHYYCQLKHRAMAYVIAGENFHATGCSPEAEKSLVAAGKSLALTCSLAFGFEPMQCLRCLDEALQSQK